MTTLEVPLSPTRILKIVSNVLNIMSSLSCIGIIILFMLEKTTRSFATSIVFQLCIWCLISHFIVLIIDPLFLGEEKGGEKNIICQLQGAFLTTFDNALLFWPTLLFTISLINFKKPQIFIKHNVLSTLLTGIMGWSLPIIWGIM